jgi:bacterioferritin-associated ferredoxin
VYVCICHAVTDQEIGAVIATGASTTEEIGARCDAGTGCGSCVDRLETMLCATHPMRYATVAG